MRKVELRMNEERKYKVIKKLVETNGNKKRAAIELDVTVRQINRMIAGYKAWGKEFFVHGNRGRQPQHALSPELKQKIIDLYTSKYWDCNYRFFTELLAKHENINVSESVVRKLLIDEYLISPKCQRKTKRRIKRELEQKKESTTSKREIESIQANIVAIQDAHPSQPRSTYFGEELQMDACEHLWFGNSKTSLHASIDDSTNQVVGAYFDHAETLFGYYKVTEQFLTKYGIPYMIKTDRRTVFEYKKKNSPSDEDDTFTQYSYACSQLGIAIETSSTPEFKPRIERLFQTLQARLPIELRLAGITTIEEANAFLPKFLEEFNKQFALCINDTKSVFDNQVDSETINLTLSILSQRTVDSGHSIKYHNKLYRTIDNNGNNIFYAKGTKCMVIKTLNGDLYASIDKEIYVLEEIPIRNEKSPNFDNLVEIKPIKRKIPNMYHPWRRKSFETFVAKQSHRIEQEMQKEAS